MPNKQDLLKWKNLEVTQDLFKRLKARREEIGEFLLQGGHLTSERSDVVSARYVGIAEAVQDMLTLRVFEQDSGDENDVPTDRA